MKKSKNKPILVITVISAFICGCPGMILLSSSIPNLIDGISQLVFNGNISNNAFISLLLNIGLVCLSGLLLLVPLGLGVYLWTQRSKKAPLESLELTGISGDEPIPPPT
ncbi:MAG: hypothetical protein ACNA70_01350 [Brevefilum sp.]